MINDHFSSLDLLRILNTGFREGVFSGCNESVINAIQTCLNEPLEKLKISKASGYKVDTYIIPFTEHVKVRGLIVKVLPLNLETLISSTFQEFTILQQVFSIGGLYTLPTCFADFKCENYRIFVSQLLPGKMASEIFLETDDIVAMSVVIRQLQSDISVTQIGVKKLSEAKSVAETSYYASKIRRFLKETFCFEVDGNELDIFGTLEVARKLNPVIVSDRSPTNFVIDDFGKIGVFDFGLLLVGVPWEDWSWFIDDPRLNSSLSREEIIKIFCNSQQNCFHGDANIVTVFHLSAIFVCIKQYCLMLEIHRDEMALHYLARARLSAEEVSSEEIVNIISKMKNFNAR